MRKLKEFIDKYTFSVITGFWAMGFLIAAMIIPPAGEIHPSVLTAVGEIFGFVAAVSGIREWGMNSRAKYRSVPEDETEN